ncbi:MAG: tetratricopeptide repeat protein [Labilithrix sp.]|nr:tetratricopeptide repeat protein [Labilithrix sp.]
MRLTDGTRFVGREEDLGRIHALLAAGERVVTVVGQPGIGKTRLVQELVRADARGASFCSLAEAVDVEGIVRGVASGLGVSLPAMGSPVAQLGRIFVDRPVRLLVLDNVEQVIAPVREVLTMWRDFAPDVSFVVTSRERLLLGGEVVHELSSLAREARGDVPSEALELLLDRVARAGRTYASADPELAHLEEIAARLEGLPLAIELVAPRIALLGARTVARRLAERSDLLSLSPLRAALEWSWSLLSPAEQRALARTSVFVSGFTASAAEVVLGEDALELLQALRQKSLLVVTGDRFGFAFSVRDLAAEKLAEMELRGPTEVAHARWFAEWAAASEERADAPDTLHALALERENLLVAIQRSLGTGTVDGIARSLRLASGLHTLAWTQGPFDGYEAVLTQVVEAAEWAGLETTAVAWALASRGQARRRLGRREEAVSDLTRSVAITERAGDLRFQGRVLCRLGTALADARRFAQATQTFERALELARANDDRVWEAYCLYGLGLVANENGEAERASERLDRAARLFADVGARAMVGYASVHLATVWLSMGSFEQALRCFDVALAAHRETGNAWWEALTICGLGTGHLLRGDPEEAIRHFDRGLADLQRMGDERSWAVYRAFRALALHARGDKAEACADLAHAVDRVRGRGDVRSTLLLLAQLGGLQAELDDVDAAERSLAEAERLLAGVDVKAASAILPAERVILDLARAREAERRGRHDEATELVARARASFAALEGTGESPEPSLERSFYYVRLSFDRARRALAEARSGAPPAEGRASITIDAHGRWIVASDGRRHSLARKVTLQRLLRRLAEARSTAPGRPVSSEDLVVLGWPEERVGYDAAMNRLRVAIARLRQLGLEHLLVGQRGGYLLDAEVVVHAPSLPGDARNDS